MYIYRTYFKLTACVNDFDAAYRYLREDDMKYYLKDDSRCPDDVYNKIISIDWILQDECSGYIELKTTEALNDVELNNISDWVSGQNSDGLGEGFEQQSFAYYENEDEEYDESYSYDTDDYDYLYITAEFDWRTNNYKFELVEELS